MFKELAPYLRQRAVLLTVTHLEDDRIRVNVLPQKLRDGENAALTTPLTVSGTAEELDRDLPATLVNFVGSHLGLKNSLDQAKQEIDAAAKAAKAEARSKAKTPGTQPAARPEVTKPAAVSKPAEQTQPAPSRAASLFDTTVLAAASPSVRDEEEEVLRESGDEEQFMGEGETEEAA